MGGLKPKSPCEKSNFRVLPSPVDMSAGSPLTIVCQPWRYESTNSAENKGFVCTFTHMYLKDAANNCNILFLPSNLCCAKKQIYIFSSCGWYVEILAPLGKLYVRLPYIPRKSKGSELFGRVDFQLMYLYIPSLKLAFENP